MDFVALGLGPRQIQNLPWRAQVRNPKVSLLPFADRGAFVKNHLAGVLTFYK